MCMFYLKRVNIIVIYGKAKLVYVYFCKDGYLFNSKALLGLKD